MESRQQLTKPSSSNIQVYTTNDLYKAALNNDFKLIVLAERTLTPAVSFGKASLSKIKKHDEKNLYQVIENLLVKCSLSLNIGKKLGEWQIMELAGDIYQKYYYFSLEEVILTLKKGRNGEYGPIYDRLDAAVIMNWFEKYDTSEERMGLVQNRRVSQMQEGKKEVDEALFKIFEYPQIKDLINALAEKKVEETPKTKTIYNSKDEYIKFLNEALPELTPEDREKVKQAAKLNEAGYVIEIIEAFEKENEGHKTKN